MGGSSQASNDRLESEGEEEVLANGLKVGISLLIDRYLDRSL